MNTDFHSLPQLKDSITYVYLEHSIIEQDDMSICSIDKDRKTPIPVASTTCLLLGPGTKITHAAVRTLADNGCSVVWCGEHIRRFYSIGNNETRSAKNILKQARLCMNDALHLEVVKRMYLRRFPSSANNDYSLQQLRGLEGARVKMAYKTASRLSGIKWNSRNYKTYNWDDADEINKALSMANALLYSVCQAAIETMGFSTALGFIHTGKMLSFVYDIADLYKAETTIPAAFEAVKNMYQYKDLSTAVRSICRQKFKDINILKRIPKDIAYIFDVKIEEQNPEEAVGELWSTDETSIPGGVNYDGA